MVAYLTTAGTGPWIVGGLIVGAVALVGRGRAAQPNRALLLILAVLALVFTALAILALAASQACEGAGGCMH